MLQYYDKSVVYLSFLEKMLIRVSPVFLRTHTLRKFADEKRYAVDA